MPRVRSKAATSRDIQLSDTLASMLNEGEPITARSVARKFKLAPTSLTRDKLRMSLISAAVNQQSQNLAWLATQKK